jgi:hypothetical protein
MGRFTKIEVHFDDEVAGPRRVVIVPNTEVQGIILRRSANELTFLNGVSPGTIDPKDLPRGLAIEGQVIPREAAFLGVDRGPDDVCYLQGGVLKCWKLT